MACQRYRQSKSVSHGLEDLFQSKDSLCFLVGAGISVDKPCSLPTGYEFTRYALQSLIPEEERENILALMDANREEARGPGDFLRFEQLMQYMQGWFDPDLHILDCFAAPSTPNLNHLFLAHMIKLGHLVFTTNFDSMIEHALLKTRTPKHRIIPIIYRKDWETPAKKIDYYVYKLHGSLIDIRTGDEYNCRDTLQATLEQIAQMKEGNIFTLEPWKKSILQKALQTHNLVVLGYSGLDDFDVLPTLWGISSSKKVIWVSHVPSLDIQDAVIHVVHTTSPSSKSAHYEKATNRTEGNLLSFIEKEARSPGSVIWIQVDTSKLIEWLWKRYIHQPLNLNNLGALSSTSKSFPLDLGLSQLEKWTLTGMIFYDRDMPSQSLKAYQTALSHSQGQWRQQWTSHDAAYQYIVESEKLNIQLACVNNIGVLLRDENRLDESVVFYQRAQNLAERMDDIQGLSTALTNLGDIFEKQGELQEALENYHQAITLAESIHDLKGKAGNLARVGRIHQKQEKPDALQYFIEALRINEQLGNLPGKAKTLNLIGLLHQKNGQHDKALDLFHQSLEISESLGDLSGAATTLFNIAFLAEEQDEWNTALTYYQRAADIYTILEDPDGTADSIEAINSLLARQRDRD